MGRIGGARVAGSLRAVPDYDDAILGVAMSLDEAQWQINITAEQLRATDHDAWNTKAQVRYTHGDVQLGAGVSAPLANDHDDATEVFAQFTPVAGLDLTGLIRSAPEQDVLAVAGATGTPRF